MVYPATHSPATSSTDSGGKAAVAFISGLVGLLAANIVLGPPAITLGVLALRGTTTRRGRAALGITLGIADLVVFLVLAVHSAAGSGSPLWHFGSL